MGMWVNSRKGNRMEWPGQGIGDRVGPLSELSESQLHRLVSREEWLAEFPSGCWGSPQARAGSTRVPSLSCSVLRD